jgi:hypothetical protein
VVTARGQQESTVAAIAAPEAEMLPEPTPPTKAEPKPVEEREINIVDLTGSDGKTIQTTTSFTMTWKDPETGRINSGTFTAKRPSLGTLGQIAVYRAKLNGGQQVDPQTNFLHSMMADLFYILTEAPDWWQPDTFFTANPLQEVWDHVRSWLDSFRKPRLG